MNLRCPNPISGPLQDSAGAKRFMSELMNTLAGASFSLASIVEGSVMDALKPIGFFSCQDKNCFNFSAMLTFRVARGYRLSARGFVNIPEAPQALRTALGPGPHRGRPHHKWPAVVLRPAEAFAIFHTPSGRSLQDFGLQDNNLRIYAGVEFRIWL